MVSSACCYLLCHPRRAHPASAAAAVQRQATEFLQMRQISPAGQRSRRSSRRQSPPHQRGHPDTSAAAVAAAHPTDLPSQNWRSSLHLHAMTFEVSGAKGFTGIATLVCKHPRARTRTPNCLIELKECLQQIICSQQNARPTSRSLPSAQSTIASDCGAVHLLGS